MSLCFLIGSPRISPLQHALRILHYIEYLTYDLEEREVNIVADFFVKNVSEKEVSFYGIHSGSINFESKTEGWFTDNMWTSVLLEWARDDIGLFKDNLNLLLCESGNLFSKVELLKGPVNSFGPKPNDVYGCSCFTGWESPSIKPGIVYLFRISGILKGKSYDDAMVKDEDYDESIYITGGEPLADYMRENLVDEYREEYRKFERNYLQPAEYYHVFFERKGGRSLKIIRDTPDMVRKRVNEKFGDNRFINWCWSDTHFNIQTRANGPVLKLLT